MAGEKVSSASLLDPAAFRRYRAIRAIRLPWNYLTMNVLNDSNGSMYESMRISKDY